MCTQSCPTLQPQGLYPTRILFPWDSPGKNTGMGCHFLLQRIFPTQGSNPCLLYLLHWQVDSLPLRHLESPWLPRPLEKCYNSPLGPYLHISACISVPAPRLWNRHAVMNCQAPHSHLTACLNSGSLQDGWSTNAGISVTHIHTHTHTHNLNWPFPMHYLNWFKPQNRVLGGGQGRCLEPIS